MMESQLYVRMNINTEIINIKTYTQLHLNSLNWFSAFRVSEMELKHP